MKKIEFVKYHALSNDFIIIDLIQKRNTDINFNLLAERICHRRNGVGADGILILTKSRSADCCLDLFNSDGSWAEKSGNGLRIVAGYYFQNYDKRKKLSFEINDEIADCQIINSANNRYSIRVLLGKPKLEAKLVPMKSKSKYFINSPLKVEKEEFPVTVLSVGNPHTVMFVDNFNFDWKQLGAIIENNPKFPHRTNVEFVKIVNRSKIILHDWERGAGATGSSGTGAAAAVVAGAINGFLNRKAEVIFPTGSFFIDWSEEDDNIYLTGPVEYICRGEFILAP